MKMRLSDLVFHSPRTIEDAFRLLSELKDARVVAGGTDLLVDLKQGLIKIRDILSLKQVEELKGIDRKDNTIRVGALVTPQEIISSSLIKKYIPALQDAARSMASLQIRSIATIGGNISSAVPSADLPPILIAADASVELCCADASREILLSDFFIGPRETVCRYEELLTQVLIPIPLPNTGMSYQKFSLREANALAVASVASRLTIKKGRIERAAIVLGAVSPTPAVSSRATEFLTGKNPSSSLFEEAGRLAKEECSPISDIRGSIWFRKELIPVLTRRSLSQALKRAQEKSRRK